MTVLASPRILTRGDDVWPDVNWGAIFSGVAGGLEGLDLLLQLIELALLAAPQLLMDGLDLLVEVVLLLGLLHLLLDLHVDPLVDVDLLDLDVEQVVKALQALVGVDQLEQRLLLGGRHHQVGREDVGDAVGVVELQSRHQPLERQVVGHLGVLLEGREDLAHVGPQLLAHRVVDLVGLHLDAQGAVGILDAHDLAALDPLDHHPHVAVGQLEVLDHRRDHTHVADVVAQRIVDPGVLLGGQEDPLGGARERLLQGPHRALPADDERGHHVREDHHVPQGDQRQDLALLGDE